MKTKLSAIALLFTGVVASAGCSSVSEDGKEWVVPPTEEVAETTQALTGTHKLCSVIVGGNWRDTILVGDSWTASTCNNFRASIGATSYSLGCVTTSGYSNWGLTNGGLPAPNCGW